MNWYYDQGGQRQGPVPESEIDRLLASGAINETTLVWREGMANWAPLREARPTGGGAAASVPVGWIRCTATGRYFPPAQIVYLDGKPYSAEAKASLVQGVMQGGALPSVGDDERTGPAWEQRAQLGFFPAIWQTIKGVLLDPGRTFATMKREGGVGTPLGYHVLLGSVGGIASLFYQLVLQMGGLSSLPPEVKEKMFSAIGGTGAGLAIVMVVALVAMPLMMVISTFVSAGIMHLSLMICGGAKQPFETTLRTYCYSSGSGAAFQLIPFCGASIGGIWALVCMCIGMAKTHEISTGRAVCAVLLPTVACCVVVMVIVAAVFGTILSAQGIHH